MHEPDHRPKGEVFDKEFDAQVFSTISYFLFVFPPIGIIVSYLAIEYAKRVGNERAKGTAIGALIFNIIVLIIALLVYVFLKEASMAI